MAMPANKFAELKTTINNANMSGEQLSELNRLIVDSMRIEANKATLKFSRGNKVQWVNTRNGVTMTGTVDRIGPKNIVVNCGKDGNWRVTATLLTLVK